MIGAQTLAYYTSLIYLVAVLCIPLVYVVATVVSKAFFNCKLHYQTILMSKLLKGKD